MKLAVLGGGGVRMPAFVRALLSGGANIFDEISLFEPDPFRRQTTARLAVEVATALGHAGVVTVTADHEEAFTDAAFVFSAIRVGGDQGRVIDEEVALKRGLVGQETDRAGRAAMALRTIPVVLSYCESLARCSPNAVFINFTNPAGMITQALSLQRDAGGGSVRHPGRGLGTARRLPWGHGGDAVVPLCGVEPLGLDCIFLRRGDRAHRRADGAIRGTSTLRPPLCRL